MTARDELLRLWGCAVDEPTMNKLIDAYTHELAEDIRSIEFNAQGGSHWKRKAMTEGARQALEFVAHWIDPETT